MQAFLCNHHYKGGRSELPKIHDIPRQLGSLITQGISVNSSYSSDVKVSSGTIPHYDSWEAAVAYFCCRKIELYNINICH